MDFHTTPVSFHDFEVKSNMFWQSYDMLQALSAENPDIKFNFVIKKIISKKKY